MTSGDNVLPLDKHGRTTQRSAEAAAEEGSARLRALRDVLPHIAAAHHRTMVAMFATLAAVVFAVIGIFAGIVWISSEISWYPMGTCVCLAAISFAIAYFYAWRARQTSTLLRLGVTALQNRSITVSGAVLASILKQRPQVIPESAAHMRHQPKYICLMLKSVKDGTLTMEVDCGDSWVELSAKKMAEALADI